MVAVYESATLHQMHAYYAKDASKNWVALDHLADQSIALGQIGNASSPEVDSSRESSFVSLKQTYGACAKQTPTPTNITNRLLDLA